MRFPPILIALCVLFGVTARTHAFCFAPELRVSDEYYASDLVVTGTVVGSKDITDPQDRGYVDGTYYTIRIDTTRRGTSYRVIRVFSENSTARFPMDTGVRYVLFLTKSPNRNWIVDNCGNSGPVVSSSATIDSLKALPLRQSFVYGEVYNWQNNDKCSPMQLTLRSAKLVVTTDVKENCSFEANVPPGQYEAILRRDGVPVTPNIPNYNDAYCFIVPAGGSAGIAFRLADGADELNRKSLGKEDLKARSLCKKRGNPRYLFF